MYSLDLYFPVAQAISLLLHPHGEAAIVGEHNLRRGEAYKKNIIPSKLQGTCRGKKSPS